MRARAAGIAIMGALLLLLCTAVLPIAALPGWEARQAASASRPTSSSSSSSTEAPFTFGPSVYTAPSAFPTSAFQSFYLAPTGTDQEPRPAITDVAHTDFYPDSLVNPTMLPTGAPSTEAIYPAPSGTAKPPATLADEIKANITAIINGNDTDCNKCLAALPVAQKLARANPQAGPQVMIDLCKQYKYKSPNTTCQRTYAPAILGSQYTQVLSYADFTSPNSTDAQYICSINLGKCPLPAPRELDSAFLHSWFRGKTQKPKVPTKKHPGKPKFGKHGKRENLRVLHFSDIHVDPRFLIGSEAACTNGQCCRADSYNGTLTSSPPGSNASALVSPAVYWGNFHCDAPWPLTMAALESIEVMAGEQGLDMSLYTGDMVTHDAAWHLSHDLVTYTQQSMFDLFKAYLGNGPVFAAIGNHDSAPSDGASPHSLPDGRGNQFSWDWDNVARLWQAEGWFTAAEAEQARSHHAGYSVSPRKGLRIITINTDFWYKSNIFNMINTTNPDVSGTLRFLTDELQAAEHRGEKVWVVGHVLSGWDGSNPLDNPTNLWYQIVARYAPHTLAHIFFGHTHEDQFSVFYSNNGTSRNTSDALATAFMAPSITPSNNVNPAYRIYEVDPVSYEVVDYHEFFSPVQDFATLSTTGPTWRHLYSAREAYSNFSASAAAGTYAGGAPLTPNGTWPASAPLNGSFWAALTDEMEARPELVQTFTRFQGRDSPRSPPCTSEECVKAKICYMRSGSAILGKECIQGYGSVQSG